VSRSEEDLITGRHPLSLTSQHCDPQPLRGDTPKGGLLKCPWSAMSTRKLAREVGDAKMTPLHQSSTTSSALAMRAAMAMCKFKNTLTCGHKTALPTRLARVVEQAVSGQDVAVPDRGLRALALALPIGESLATEGRLLAHERQRAREVRVLHGLHDIRRGLRTSLMQHLEQPRAHS
jgi:hypothetical protein